MKIAQIVPSLEERHGGPSKSVRRLASALAQLGHDVDLLATQPGAATVSRPEPRLRVHQFPRGLPEALCPSPELRAHLEREAYDCVHHHALWLRTLAYARGAADRTGARLVISPRGMLSDWAWGHHRWKKRLASRWVHPGAIARADGWHATSAAEADEIRRRGFLQPVCVAPNGVEAPSADEMTQAHEHWVQLCPAASTRPVALFYARFHRKKRPLELIELWLRLAAKDWLLLVVGLPEEYTVAELRDRIGRSAGVDRVVLFDGSDRPPPYAVASLFLLPSHSENFGLAVAEAMAWGLPVVVTDTTPWAEVATENAGWCVPWEHYGDALGSALGERGERLEQRGARARDWVLRRFSWLESARRLAKFYGARAHPPS